MIHRPEVVRPLARSIVSDCLIRSGAWRSLVSGAGRHIHCRNCPVVRPARRSCWTALPPTVYLASGRVRSRSRSMPRTSRPGRSSSCVAAEWLALPTSVVMEIANVLPIHSLRTGATTTVLAGQRTGEVSICVSLGRVVGVEPVAAAGQPRRARPPSACSWIRREDVRAVCPVDEVHGIHRFHPRELRTFRTVAKAPVTHSTAVLWWRERAGGLARTISCCFTRSSGVSMSGADLDSSRCSDCSAWRRRPGSVLHEGLFALEQDPTLPAELEACLLRGALAERAARIVGRRGSPVAHAMEDCFVRRGRTADPGARTHRPVLVGNRPAGRIGHNCGGGSRPMDLAKNRSSTPGSPPWRSRCRRHARPRSNLERWPPPRRRRIAAPGASTGLRGRSRGRRASDRVLRVTAENLTAC